MNYLLINTIWLFVGGSILLLLPRTVMQRGPVLHLLWVLLLIKILLPPLVVLPISVSSTETPTKSRKGNAAQSPGNPPLAQESAEKITQEVAHKIVQEVPQEFAQEVEQHQPESTPPPFFEAESSLVIPPGDYAEYGFISGSLEEKEKEKEKEKENASGFDYVKIVPFVWFGGSLLFLVVAVYRIGRFQRLLRFAEPVEPEFQQRIDRVAAQMGVRAVPVLLLDAVLPPLVWAFLQQPKILLSRALKEQTPVADLELLLSHELAHLRRRDHFVRYVELSATILHWWNPMLWLARRELRETEELCCDAWTKQIFPLRNRDYGAALLNTLDFLNDRQPMRLPATGSGMSMKETQRRIEMIVKFHIPTRIPRTIAVLLVLLTAIVLPLSLTTNNQAAPQEKPTPTPESPQKTEPFSEEPKTAIPEPKEDTLTLVAKCRYLNSNEKASDKEVFLCDHVVFFKWNSPKNLFEFVRFEVRKIESKKTDAAGIARFENIPYPKDTRWFNQKTGEKYTTTPEETEAEVHSYFFTVREKGAFDLGPNMEIQPRFLPKKFNPNPDRLSSDTFEQELILSDTVDVVGVLVDPQGKPLEGANLCLSGFSQISSFFSNRSDVPLPQATTDTQGQFRLNNFPRHVRVESQNMPTFQYPTLWIQDKSFGEFNYTFDKDQAAETVFVRIQVSERYDRNIKRRGSTRAPRQPAEPAQDSTWWESGQIIDAATQKPLAGVSVRFRQTMDDNVFQQGGGKIQTTKTDEGGNFRFEGPGTRLKNNHVEVLPFKQEDRVLVARRDIAENVNHFEMVEGHLLIGQVFSTVGMRTPLKKTDDGKPIRIALNRRGAFGMEKGRYQFDPLQITEVNKQGEFRFYVPEGVCFPIILDNGEDVIWGRVQDNDRWANEGFLIRPGKINVVKFSVEQRIDDWNVSPSVPVPEEQEIATRLALSGCFYELDENKHIGKVVLQAKPIATNPRTGGMGPPLGTISKLLPDLKELKQLKTLDFMQISLSLCRLPKSEYKELSELPALESVIVPGETNDNPRTLRGEEMKQFLLGE